MAFTFNRIFTDMEEKILKDRIIGEPVDWINGAIDGKLNNSLKALASRRRKELLESGALTVPAKDIDLAKDAFSDPGYKNAKTRTEIPIR